jgi:hypothetical protein
VDVVLWLVQVILAVLFLMAGGMKVLRSKEQLAEDPRMGWVEEYDQNQIRGIGGAEVLGALGLVLPGLTGIATVLTPIAAIGLAITMLLASLLHRRRGESQATMMTAAFFILALVVAIGRFARPL